MKEQELKILVKFENHLDTSKYKIYKESIKHFNKYAIINYQSNSVVDFNIPNDDMIYGIGTLMYRRSDGKIFEIYSHSSSEEQIIRYLKTS